MICRNFCMRQKILFAASWDFNIPSGRPLGHEKRVQNRLNSQKKAVKPISGIILSRYTLKNTKNRFSMMCRNFCMRQKILFTASWNFNNQSARHLGHENELKNIEILESREPYLRDHFIEIYATKNRKTRFFDDVQNFLHAPEFCWRPPETSIISLEGLWDMKN